MRYTAMERNWVMYDVGNSALVLLNTSVVPIYFDGRNSDKFYRLANIGKRLGLKFNIAMLYLSDEMFKHRGDTFHVYIGRPIPWQTFDASRRPSEWATWVQQAVYDIPHTR